MGWWFVAINARRPIVSLHSLLWLPWGNCVWAQTQYQVPFLQLFSTNDPWRPALLQAASEHDQRERKGKWTGAPSSGGPLIGNDDDIDLNNLNFDAVESVQKNPNQHIVLWQRLCWRNLQIVSSEEDESKDSLLGCANEGQKLSGWTLWRVQDKWIAKEMRLCVFGNIGSQGKSKLSSVNCSISTEAFPF